MEMERKAMYNLLRMNWLLDPSMAVDKWQVEDYREKPLDSLFKELKELGISLNEEHFLEYVDQHDTPEELADHLMSETHSPKQQDHVYLLLFELWRRLSPERSSLSIFCDELDYLIYLYDKGKLENPESAQDILANLAHILEENADTGADPEQIFQSIEAHCGNDLESFLYDFIAEEIDEELYDSASELLDLFYPFVKEKKWFDFLRARLIAPLDRIRANTLIQEHFEEHPEESDIEFELEILQSLARWGNHHLFLEIADRACSLVHTEDELQDLLSICADYYKCLDHDEEDSLIQQMISKRSSRPPETLVCHPDGDIHALKTLIQKRL